MLTEANLKENLIEATFVNDDRTIIEVLFTSDNTARSAIIEYDTNHPDFQALMKVISVDDLHEMTWQKKKDERKSFENEVKLIAEKEGLIKKIAEHQERTIARQLGVIIKKAYSQLEKGYDL